MRIGLLLADDMPEEFLPIAGEYLEMFTTMFGEREVTLVPFEAYRGQLPEHVRECEGYLISGSRAAAYTEAPAAQEEWIAGLEEFIRNSVQASVPIFGVCFGLQVMATALGGVVERFRGGWGVGVQTMKIGQPRAWMTGSTDSISLIMLHQDQVVTLPESAVLLGSSSHCEKYLVEFTPIHVGIQGHPEFAAPFTGAVYRGRRERLGDRFEGAIASLHSRTDAQLVADWIVEFFESALKQPEKSEP